MSLSSSHFHLPLVSLSELVCSITNSIAQPSSFFSVLRHYLPASSILRDYALYTSLWLILPSYQHPKLSARPIFFTFHGMHEEFLQPWRAASYLKKVCNQERLRKNSTSTVAQQKLKITTATTATTKNLLCKIEYS